MYRPFFVNLWVDGGSVELWQCSLSLLISWGVLQVESGIYSYIFNILILNIYIYILHIDNTVHGSSARMGMKQKCKKQRFMQACRYHYPPTIHDW